MKRAASPERCASAATRETRAPSKASAFAAAAPMPLEAPVTGL